MWSKGAVVIKKHGDPEIANAVASAMDIRMPPISSEELAALRRDNTFLRRRTTEQLKKDILKAEIDYGYNWIPPWWAKKTLEYCAFVVYVISEFIDRYLRF